MRDSFSFTRFDERRQRVVSKIFCRLLPHEIETRGLIQQFARVWEDIVRIGVHQCREQARLLLSGTHNARFARDSNFFRGFYQSVAVAALTVDKAERKGLLA